MIAFSQHFHPNPPFVLFVCIYSLSFDCRQKSLSLCIRDFRLAHATTIQSNIIEMLFANIPNISVSMANYRRFIRDIRFAAHSTGLLVSLIGENDKNWGQGWKNNRIISLGMYSRKNKINFAHSIAIVTPIGKVTASNPTIETVDKYHRPNMQIHFQ